MRRNIFPLSEALISISFICSFIHLTQIIAQYYQIVNIPPDSLWRSLKKVSQAKNLIKREFTAPKALFCKEGVSGLSADGCFGVKCHQIFQNTRRLRTAPSFLKRAGN
jgi:hypothetical protein